MLARLTIQVPFHIAIAKTATFPVHEHHIDIGIIKTLGALASPTEQEPDAPTTADAIESDNVKSKVGNDPPERDAL
jgi:hypothetical protein